MAFDAEDAEVIGRLWFGSISAGESGAISALCRIPQASLLSFSTNAFDIWLALKDEGEPPLAIRHDEPQRLLVWRREVTPAVRIALPEEAMMWSEAAQGVNFSRSASLWPYSVGRMGADLRSAGYLLGWLNEGLLAEASGPASVTQPCCLSGIPALLLRHNIGASRPPVAQKGVLACRKRTHWSALWLAFSCRLFSSRPGLEKITAYEASAAYMQGHGLPGVLLPACDSHGAWRRACRASRDLLALGGAAARRLLPALRRLSSTSTWRIRRRKSC